MTEPRAPIRAKWRQSLVLAALLATPACAVATHHPRTVSYDYSDADHYDVKHAPSPDYRVEAPAPTGSKARKRRPIVVEIVRGR